VSQRHTAGWEPARTHDFGIRRRRAATGQHGGDPSACLAPPEPETPPPRTGRGTRPPSRDRLEPVPRPGPRRMHRLGEVKLCIGGNRLTISTGSRSRKCDFRRQLSARASRGATAHSRRARPCRWTAAPAVYHALTSASRGSLLAHLVAGICICESAFDGSNLLSAPENDLRGRSPPSRARDGWQNDEAVFSPPTYATVRPAKSVGK